MEFDIKLIRKIFIYEQINNKKFEMINFKQLLKLDNELINQNKFREWVDNNHLLVILKEWLDEYGLDKTFSEVYVVGKSDTEMLIDFLYDYGDDIPEKNRGKMLTSHIDDLKKKRKETFE